MKNISSPYWFYRKYDNNRKSGYLSRRWIFNRMKNYIKEDMNYDHKHLNTTNFILTIGEKRGING